jgi:hypothetical protein
MSGRVYRKGESVAEPATPVSPAASTTVSAPTPSKYVEFTPKEAPQPGYTNGYSTLNASNATAPAATVATSEMANWGKIDPETGDLTLTAGLGLLRDGNICLQSCDHEDLVRVTTRTVEIFGNLVVSGTVSSRGDTRGPVNDVKSGSSHPDLMQPNGGDLDNEFELKGRGESRGRSKPPKVTPVRRVNVGEDTKITMKLTGGTGILDFVLVCEPEESPLDLEIRVVWDSTQSLAVPLVFTQFIGPLEMSFRVVELDEDGMLCYLLGSDRGIENCRVHYRILD